MLKKIVTITFLTLFAHGISYACSCLPQGTVRKEFEKKSEVFIARIAWVRPQNASVNDHKADPLYKMTVEKVYKGDLKPGDSLTFIFEGSNCGVFYDEEDVGWKILLYKNLPAIGKGASWSQSVCERRIPLEMADEDLLYLDKLADVVGKTRISGTIVYEEDSPVEGRPDVRQKLAEWQVTIRGKDIVREVRTDKNGVFEVYDLPPGRYSISAAQRKNWAVSFSRTINETDASELLRKGDSALTPKELVFDFESAYVLAGGHSSKNFTFGPDNSISGTVRGPNGKPLKDVELRLISAEGKPSDRYLWFSDSDDNGYFSFENVTPGKYYVVANERNEIKTYRPYGRYYYPGVAAKKAAGKVTIGYGDHLKGLTMRIPRFRPMVKISGRMIYADGTPVIKEAVDFSPEELQLEIGGKDAERELIDESAVEMTDARGRFQFKVFKGSRGKITPLIFTQSADCQPQTTDTASGFKFNVINEPAVPVSASRNITGILIRLPVNKCKKKE